MLILPAILAVAGIMVVVIVCLPIVIPLVARDRWRRRKRIQKYLQSKQGTLVLVWHSRRGWHDFCLNNLLPVVPENITVTKNTHRSLDDLDIQDWYELERLIGWYQVVDRAVQQPPKRPYLLHFNNAQVKFMSLNAVLQPYKRFAKRSREVQGQVSAAIQTAMYDFVRAPSSCRQAL